MDLSVSGIDDRSKQPSHFMLYHYNAAGVVDRERLLVCLPHSSPTAYYLIDDATKEASSTVQESSNSDYSTARLELHQTHAVLSVFQETGDGNWILPKSDEIPFRIPVSSEFSKILIILRQGDHFVASSGRWSVTLMKDPPKSSGDRRATATNLRLCTVSPVSIVTLPPKDSTDHEDHGHSSIQRHNHTDHLRIPEAIQKHKIDVIRQTDSQDPISADEIIDDAVKTALSAQTVSTWSVTNSVTVAAEGYLNPHPAIAIHADASCEDASPTSDAFHRDKHLKGLSVNLPSKIDYDQDKYWTLKRPYQSISSQHEAEDTSEEVESPRKVPHTPPVSRNGNAGVSPNGAAVDACNEHGENEGTARTIRQPNWRKRKQVTYSTPRSESSSKERHGHVLPEPANDDDDAIPAGTKSSKSDKNRSPPKAKGPADSSIRQSRKVSVNGSPAASVRSSILSETSLSLPGSKPPVSRSRRVSPSNTYQGPSLRAIFSGSTTVDSKTNVMESFRSFGGSVTKSIRRADVLCVSSGALKKTTKLITAVALGKYVVDERWLVESHRKRTLLAPEAFVPEDALHEREWGFELKAAIARGRNGLNNELLNAISVYFTRQLEIDLGDNFMDFCQIAVILGAYNMGVNLPANDSTEKTVVVGVNNDPQAPLVRSLGLKLHQKDLLVMGVLRGLVDLESDEFVINAPVKGETDA